MVSAISYSCVADAEYLPQSEEEGSNIPAKKPVQGPTATPLWSRYFSSPGLNFFVSKWIYAILLLFSHDVV